MFHGRHHPVRQTSEEGPGVSALYGARERRAHRNDLHRPRTRSDHVHARIPGGVAGRQAGRRECGREGKACGGRTEAKAKGEIKIQLQIKAGEGEMIVLKVDMLVKPGMEQRCLELIRIMQRHSRQEPGCLMYIGHQSTEDPRRFMFYEQYKDAAALEAHPNAPYFKEYVAGGLDPIMESRSRDLYVAVE